jgi:hypothetical protein
MGLIIIISFSVLIVSFLVWKMIQENNDIKNNRSEEDQRIINGIFDLLINYPEKWVLQVGDLLCEEYELHLHSDFRDEKFYIEYPKIPLTNSERKELTAECNKVKSYILNKNAKDRYERNRAVKYKLLSKFSENEY